MTDCSAKSDIELIKCFRAAKPESEAAFTELYNRYSNALHAYCMRVFDNGQQAEDIFQEAFIRFYQNIDPDKETTNVLGYLIRIARNLSLNYKRDKKNNVPIDKLEFVSVSNQNYEKKELLDLITMALELLDEKYREAFVLREYDGLPYEEIASVCKTTVNNAKSRVFRAKKKIKEVLQPYLKDLCK